MVWVNLVFIESMMGQNDYLDILKEHLKQNPQYFDLEANFCFEQNNDPNYTFHCVRGQLYNTKNKLFSFPQSPDLNSISYGT